ncbi:hypothetical protein Q31b_01030 [Novipirellula aureliae]|uniref:ABC-three component systems C-terminal domain-containing protein n=1 Tax=Novipirellula aureliae TaxID=2527966 RepID=A0A5C6E7K4_9BACT|nr:ABC-three component system protein [Novipirellula aureliae]TWU44932.1 hypothetical protein Q31b_01030 [Novipirellula aureliae]
MTDFRHSVARLLVSDQHVGSAWLISRKIVCTADHCVVDSELNTNVELIFPSCRITGTVVEKDADLDIALIEVDPESHTIEPLPIIARPMQLKPSTQWQLHGHPVQNAEVDEGGLTLEGHISNAQSGTETSPRMQLSCDQGARLGEQNSPFGGVSGGPVIVCPRDNTGEVYVIGSISYHHVSQDSILYCTPIDEVVERHPQRLQETQLKSWDASRRILSVVSDDRGCRTNMDEHLILSVWQDGLTGLWCNILPDESPILTSAIERIVVQSPFATARANTELHFMGAAAWRSRCECCTKEWVPVDGVSIKKTLSKYAFVELGDEPIPLGGLRFNNIDELADHLKSQCNKWAFRRLRERVSEAFDNPVGELHYEIASDLVVPMRKLWNNWLNILKNDSSTLHHFFGLMLCSDGGVLMAESAAGTGPETIDACVLHATVYSLAVCVALPEKLSSLRVQSPGNLGQDDMSGHSCGIQIMSGKTIRMADRSHKWKTPFVMLPHLHTLWEVFRVTEARLDQEVNPSGRSFHQEPTRTLVLPGDCELMVAIEQGINTLRAVLEQRYSEFLTVQEQYVAGANNVSV